MQKNEKSRVSIIMPVYNGEKYIKECIVSLLRQTYPNIEIILVNDGSTDHSLEICDEYARRDKRIVVISQENRGVTVARRTGVSVATGEYIYFVDCDDWIDDTAVEMLMMEAVDLQADIVVSDHIREDGDGNYVKEGGVLEEGLYDMARRDELHQRMFYLGIEGGWGIWPTLWAKLFRKELIAESLNRVDTQIFYGEDTACVFFACLKAQKLLVSKHVGYHYRIYSTISMSVKKNKNLFNNMLSLHEYLYEMFSEQKNSKQLLEQLRYYMVSLMDHAGKLLFDIPYHLQQGEWMKRDVEIWRQKYLDLMEKNSFEEVRWIFPFYELKNAKKILLYGAGGVGKSYFSQIRECVDYEVVAWVDQHVDQEKNIIGLKDITNYEFDCVVIAISDTRLIDGIIEDLVAIGVEKTKIIWRKPIRISNCYIVQPTNIS